MTDTPSSPFREPDGDEAVGVPASIWDRATDSFARWRAGDVRAMDELVRTMTPVLWHVVRAYGLDRMLTEDVIQITWLTLLRSHASIHDPHAVAGWLTTCARRQAWRTGHTQQRARPTDDLVLAPLLPDDESAEDRAQLADRDRRLWRAVGVLDERCRRLLRIVAFEERPDYAHIASDLSMPIGSIGPTRQRCLGKLRTALEAGGWRGIPVTSEPVDDDIARGRVFAALRRTWRVADPVPPDLADAMVATVAAADLDRDYALLALVDSDATAAVRGDADLFTLQFSDGRTNLLVHVTPAEGGTRRLDGWVDGDVAEVRLLHEGRDRAATCADGRFAFDEVEPGISRLRVVLAHPEPGMPGELLTPRFEI